MTDLSLPAALLFAVVYIPLAVITDLWLSNRKYAKEERRRKRQVSHE